MLVDKKENKEETKSEKFERFLKLSDKKKIFLLLQAQGIQVKVTSLSLSWENRKFGFNVDGSLKYIKIDGKVVSHIDNKRMNQERSKAKKAKGFAAIKEINGDM
jgi:hypothetical protein